MSNSETNKLYNIDFCRFIAISAIVLFHYNSTICPIGFLFVEFFFIIAGFFLVKSYEKYKNFTSIIFKRFLRLYPAYAVSNLIMIYLYYISHDNINIYKIIYTFTFTSFSFIPNLPPFISWFVPALFWASFLLLIFLQIKISTKIKMLFLFFISIGIYSFILIKTSVLSGNVDSCLLYIYKGTLRAIAGVFLGGSLSYLSKLSFNKTLLQILEIIALSCFVGTLWGRNNITTTVICILYFSIYLSHTLLLKYLRINYPAIAECNIYYILSILTGIFYYVVVEKGFIILIDLIRRKYEKYYK